MATSSGADLAHRLNTIEAMVQDLVTASGTPSVIASEIAAHITAELQVIRRELDKALISRASGGHEGDKAQTIKSPPIVSWMDILVKNWRQLAGAPLSMNHYVRLALRLLGLDCVVADNFGSTRPLDRNARRLLEGL